MNRHFRGANELKIGSSILTRRGGTDANAPERPQEAIPRDWHVGILGHRFLENPGKCAQNILKMYRNVSEIGQHPMEWADDEWRKDKILLRTFSKGSRALNP